MAKTNHPNQPHLAKPKAANAYIVDGRPLFLVGREAETVDLLMRGPVPAPSIYRRASYVCDLRQKGIRIETVWSRSSNGVRFGTYHLKSRISRKG
jgi:hypothetical protein